MWKKVCTCLLISVVEFTCLLASEKPDLSDFVSKSTFKENRADDILPSSNALYYYILTNNMVIRYKFADGLPVDTPVNTVNPSFDKNIDIASFSFDNSEHLFLLAYNIKPLYRYSFYASYVIYNSLTNECIKVSEAKRIRDAQISPDGSKVAYCYKHNLYVFDINKGQTIQITYDGDGDSIINAEPDWMYEEEFSLLQAFKWSPDSKSIVYYKLNQKAVMTYPLTNYTKSNRFPSDDLTYPYVINLKYPKVGKPIAQTSLYVYDLQTRANTMIVNVGENYITEFKWSIKSDNVVYTYVNRAQNKYNIEEYNCVGKEIKVLYNEQTNTSIEFPDVPSLFFINDKNDFVFLSNKTGYKHLYLATENGTLVKQLTTGNWEVLAIEDVDIRNKRIFLSTNQASPLQKHLYCYDLKKQKLSQLTKGKGVHKAIFSADFNNMIHSYSSLREPLKVSIMNVNSGKEKVLIDNKNVADKAIEMNVPRKDTFSFVLSSGERLYGWILKAKQDANRPAPTLFYVYGGPGIQSVLDKWEVKWYHYLAMQGYNVVSVDNRGTSNRGKSFRDDTYGKLGEIACADVVATANYLGQKAWIDTSRLAIMGWSFGGFLSSTCLQQSNCLFKAAISVAPPADWRLYDAAYTERYMGLLEDNEEKYNKTSLIVNADKTNGKLLLIHGTADDNVHVQNTLMFADALVKADKKFEMKLFTDDNHQINSQNAGIQLYNQVIDFLKKVFNK